MSSIKPPSGKTPGLPPTDVGGVSPTGAPKATSDAFRKALDEPSAVAKPSGNVVRPEPKTEAASIARLLRAGEINAETAVDKLVDKALAKAESAGLPAAKRADLEAVLRDALASDPTLSQLSKDLERGR